MTLNPDPLYVEPDEPRPIRSRRLAGCLVLVVSVAVVAAGLGWVLGWVVGR